MTERTIKAMATELAGTFYEQNRTPGFRKAFPKVEDYLRGRWHQPDGSIKLYRPGYLHHVVLARKMLIAMLGRKDTNETMKERIYDALLEDAKKSHVGGKMLGQGRLQ